MKNPCSSFPDILPADDILIFSIPSLCTVEAIGEKIVIAMVARALINIRLIPWIHGDLLRKIGTLPCLRSGRSFSKCLQSLFRRRISAHVEPEGIKGSAEEFNLGLGGLLLCQAD